MTKSAKQCPSPDRRKQDHRDKPHATGNRRLAEQVRKILRTYYTNKYRVR
jgi:hypothetical protein